MATYTVLADDLDYIHKKINRIIKKCIANHVDYEFSVSDAYTKIVEINYKSYKIDLVDINVDVAFKLNGWKPLGMVQRKDGIVQCYFKDASLIEQYKDTKFQCDHCHKGIHRNSVVILENENKEQKVVGTSCVKDFTAGLDGNLIAETNEYLHTLELRQAEIVSLMQDTNNDQVIPFYESHGIRVYNVEAIVSSAKRLIDQYGFEPSSSDKATCRYILDEYYVTKIEDEALHAIEWIRSLDESEINKSSYLFNLRQIIDANYCTFRHFGLLASLIPSYRKYDHQKKLENTCNEETISNYIGNIGDKLTVLVKYNRSFWYESTYGISYTHLFSDDMGNIFKWSTGKNLVESDGHKIPEGSTIELTGKIKAHDEYHNQKQTVLTRCKYSVITSEKDCCEIIPFKENEIMKENILNMDWFIE